MLPNTVFCVLQVIMDRKAMELWARIPFPLLVSGEEMSNITVRQEKPAAQIQGSAWLSSSMCEVDREVLVDYKLITSHQYDTTGGGVGMNEILG